MIESVKKNWELATYTSIKLHNIKKNLIKNKLQFPNKLVLIKNQFEPVMKPN